MIRINSDDGDPRIPVERPRLIHFHVVVRGKPSAIGHATVMAESEEDAFEIAARLGPGCFSWEVPPHNNEESMAIQLVDAHVDRRFERHGQRRAKPKLVGGEDGLP